MANTGSQKAATVSGDSRVATESPGEDFSMVPNRFARDPEVTPAACKVALWLASLAPSFRFTKQGISTHLAMGAKTVDRAMANLREAGYLTMEPIPASNPTRQQYIYRLDFSESSSVKMSNEIGGSLVEKADVVGRNDLLKKTKNTKRAPSGLSQEDYREAPPVMTSTRPITEDEIDRSVAAVIAVRDSMTEELLLQVESYYQTGSASAEQVSDDGQEDYTQLLEDIKKAETKAEVQKLWQTSGQPTAPHVTEAMQTRVWYLTELS